MDTSISKALIMVAGVLLAMLVIAFVTQTFNQTSQWASAEDQEKIKEEIEKFNKEWEVYDKDLMYGVDVISCLNKALSNNDKINRKLEKNGEKYDVNYEITVKVTLVGKLKESIKVYYWKYDDNISKKVLETTEDSPDEINLHFSDLNDLGYKFNVLNNSDYMGKWASFSASDSMKSIEKYTDNLSGGFTLDKNSSIPGTESERNLVYELLSFSDVISENIRNNNANANYAIFKYNGYTLGNTDAKEKYENNNGWNKLWMKLEFKSYLYDLKIRKFTCTGITYKNSGTVDTISFKEL